MRFNEAMQDVDGDHPPMSYSPQTGRIPEQKIDDGSVVFLNDPAGPKARLAFQPFVDMDIGGDEIVAGVTFDELEGCDFDGFGHGITPAPSDERSVR
jgi:hypothetical protein